MVMGILASKLTASSPEGQPENKAPQPSRPAPVHPVLPEDVWRNILRLSNFDCSTCKTDDKAIQSLSGVNRALAQLTPQAYPNYYARLAAKLTAQALSLPYSPVAPCARLEPAMQIALAKSQALELTRPVRGYPNNDGEVGNWLIEASRTTLRSLQVPGLWGGAAPLTTIDCFMRPFAQLRALSFDPASEFCAAFRAHYRPENYPVLEELHLTLSYVDVPLPDVFALNSASVLHMSIDESVLGEHSSPVPMGSKALLHWPKLETLGLHSGGTSIFDTHRLNAPRLHTLAVRDYRGNFAVLGQIDWNLMPEVRFLQLQNSPWHAMGADAVADALKPVTGHIKYLDLSEINLFGRELRDLLEMVTGKFDAICVRDDALM